MILNPFEYREKEWTAVLQPVASDVETGLEVVFIPENGGKRYAWPMGMRLLEAVVDGGISLDHHRLRKMLCQAMDSDRRPSQEATESDEEGFLSQVMLSELRKAFE